MKEHPGYSVASQLTEKIHLLGVGLIILKASGNTEWPWWAVTMPFWLPLTFAAVFFFVGLVMVAIHTAVSNYTEKRNADRSV